MPCNNECSPCSQNVCDCSPCIPIYTDQICENPVKARCVFMEDGVECLPIPNGSTVQTAIEILGQIVCDNVNGTDELVKANASDTTSEYLENKLRGSAFIDVVTINKGAGVLASQISINETALCEKVNACLVTPDNPCDVYLDPETSNPWVSSSLADTNIPTQCKNDGLTILSYDSIGNIQEYWYDGGIATANLVLKLDYKSKGVNASRIGSLYNVASYKNSVAIGHGVFIGAVKVVSAATITGSNPYTITLTTTDISAGDKVGVTYLDGDVEWSGVASANDTVVFTWNAISFTNPTPPAQPQPIPLNVSLPSSFKVVKLNVITTLPLKTGNIAAGKSAISEGDGAIALGTNPYAKGVQSVAIGNATSNGTNSVAIGGGSVANSEGSLAMAGGTASNNSAIAVGTGSIASAPSAVSLSTYGTSSGMSSFGANRYSNAVGDGSAVFGQRGLANNRSQFVSSMSKFAHANYSVGSAQWNINHLGARTSTSGTKVLSLDTLSDSSFSSTVDSSYDGLSLSLEGDVVTFEGHLMAKVESAGAALNTSTIFHIKGYYIKGVGLISNTVTLVHNSLGVSTPTVVETAGNLIVTVTGIVATNIKWYLPLVMTQLSSGIN